MILFKHPMGGEVLALDMNDTCFTSKHLGWAQDGSVKLTNTAYKPVTLVIPKEYST